MMIKNRILSTFSVGVFVFGIGITQQVGAVAPVVVAPVAAKVAVPVATNVARSIFMRLMIKGTPVIVQLIRNQAGKFVLAGLVSNPGTGTAIVAGVAATLVVHLMIEGAPIYIPLAKEGGKWIVTKSSKGIENTVETAKIVYEGGKQAIISSGKAIGDATEVVYNAGKWVAICHTGVAVGAVGGAVAGGATGSVVGASVATALCLGSIGLSAATFGSSLLLAAGFCSSAIATGTVVGMGVGAAGGSVAGGMLGKLADGEECIAKENK
jgi:hypothetical protein